MSYSEVLNKARDSKPRWKRIVLKLSGEALASSASDEVVDAQVLDQLATEIVAAKQLLGVEMTIVVGGGNIWRTDLL